MACALRRIIIGSSIYGKHLRGDQFKFNYRSFKTGSQKQKRGISNAKLLLLATATGIGAGTAYSFTNTTDKQRVAVLNSTDKNTPYLLEQFPNIKISKKVVYQSDTSGLKLTLFQYATCPFCCKVRAFLDYYGISYDIVEVNPVLRQQIKWSDYKKVPILLVKIGNKYLQLNDSTMIISALTSYLHDKDIGLMDITNSYPTISYLDDDGNIKNEILNRYFLMYQANIPSSSTKESIVDERKWRKWTDDVFVHMLSPNVYRSTEEALQAFNWFSEVGDWKQHFNSIETQLVIYVGAFAMWMIGKRLKKRHHLEEDVRVSLYNETNTWLKEVKEKGDFHGGTSPDLADLAVYGVLNSIEGCHAFQDLLQNTDLTKWYSSVKTQIENQSGNSLLIHQGI